jgi:hypothetical protein
VQDIRAKGYEVDSVWDLVNNTPHPVLERKFVGAYPNAYSVLVDHLRIPHHVRTREGIVRALTEKDAAAVAAEEVLRQFYAEQDKELRWVMANALRRLLTRYQRKKHPRVDEVYKNKDAP